MRILVWNQYQKQEVYDVSSEEKLKAALDILFLNCQEYGYWNDIEREIEEYSHKIERMEKIINVCGGKEDFNYNKNIKIKKEMEKERKEWKNIKKWYEKAVNKDYKYIQMLLEQNRDISFYYVRDPIGEPKKDLEN